MSTWAAPHMQRTLLAKSCPCTLMRLSLAMEVMLTAYYTDGREEERGVNIPAFQVAHIPIMVGSKCCHTWKLTREACKALQEDSVKQVNILPKSGE